MQMFWRHFKSALPTAINLHLLASFKECTSGLSATVPLIKKALQFKRRKFKALQRYGKVWWNLSAGSRATLPTNLFKQDGNSLAFRGKLWLFICVFILDLSGEMFIKGCASCHEVIGVQGWPEVAWGEKLIGLFYFERRAILWTWID